LKDKIKKKINYPSRSKLICQTYNPGHEIRITSWKANKKIMKSNFPTNLILKDKKNNKKKNNSGQFELTYSTQELNYSTQYLSHETKMPL
jgi:hypothetical protein